MTRYLAWMLVSAALGMGKVLAVAQVLPAAGFGQYAAAMGGVALWVIVLSFGLIEGTIKQFPRMWADGQHSALAAEFVVLARRIAQRTGVLMVATLGLGLLLLGSNDTILAVFVSVIGGISLGGRLVTAVILATGAVPPLLRVTRFRAISSFVLTVSGALVGGIHGALIGECLAALLSLAQGTRLVRGAVGPPAPGEVGQPTHPDHSLYLGTVFTAVPLMADRALVAAAAGAAVAGSYAFAMILAQVGQLFMNIMAQRVGPEIIRVAPHGTLPAVAVRGLLWNAAGLLGGTVVMTGAVLLARGIGPVGDLFAKYAVDTSSVLLAALVCICMFYSVLEYALIAVSRERVVLTASAASLLMFLASFAGAWFYGGGLTHYLVAVLASRSVQVIWLLVAVRPFLPAKEG